MFYERYISYIHNHILVAMVAKVKLERSIRLLRIRRMKLLLYVIHTAVMLILAIYMMVADGASIKPFYLPVDSFIYVVLLMLLLMCVESFFFTRLDIRFTKSFSTNYLLVRNSIRRAIVIAVITGIVAALIWTPAVKNAAENVLATSGTNRIDESGMEVYFATRDHLGLTNVYRITVSVDSGEVDVYLLLKEDYDSENSEESLQKSLNYYRDKTALPGEPLTVDLTEFGELERGYIECALVFIGEVNTTVHYTFSSLMSGTFRTYAPLICLLFVVSNVAWAVYLLPLKKKYAVASIYK